MSLKIWILNAIILIFIICFNLRTYNVWFDEKVDKGPHHLSSSKKIPTHEMLSFRPQNIPEEKYDPIVIKNLFSPERSGPTDMDSPETLKDTSKGKKGANVFLYGVVISGKVKKALISNPDYKSRKKRQVWLEEGEKAGKLKLVEIRKESVVLKVGANKFEIFLNDQNKPRTASHNATVRKNGRKREKIPNIISIGPEDKRLKGHQPDLNKKSGMAKYKIINTPFGKIKKRIK